MSSFNIFTSLFSTTSGNLTASNAPTQQQYLPVGVDAKRYAAAVQSVDANYPVAVPTLITALLSTYNYLHHHCPTPTSTAAHTTHTATTSPLASLNNIVNILEQRTDYLYADDESLEYLQPLHTLKSGQQLLLRWYLQLCATLAPTQHSWSTTHSPATVYIKLHGLYRTSLQYTTSALRKKILHDMQDSNSVLVYCLSGGQYYVLCGVELSKTDDNAVAASEYAATAEGGIAKAANLDIDSITTAHGKSIDKLMGNDFAAIDDDAASEVDDGLLSVTGQQRRQEKQNQEAVNEIAPLNGSADDPTTLLDDEMVDTSYRSIFSLAQQHRRAKAEKQSSSGAEKPADASDGDNVPYDRDIGLWTLHHERPRTASMIERGGAAEEEAADSTNFNRYTIQSLKLCDILADLADDSKQQPSAILRFTR